MKYILSGDAKEVEKVLRENRIRESRGLIKFEPVPAEVAEDAKEPAIDSKEPKVADTKSTKKTTKK